MIMLLSCARWPVTAILQLLTMKSCASSHSTAAPTGSEDGRFVSQISHSPTSSSSVGPCKWPTPRLLSWKRTAARRLLSMLCDEQQDLLVTDLLPPSQDVDLLPPSQDVLTRKQAQVIAATVVAVINHTQRRKSVPPLAKHATTAR